MTALIPVSRPGTVPGGWWNDSKMVSLVRRTAARDCDQDEFNLFTAVCRELGLNPLRKQIYAFVFSKDDPNRRNMALVIGIDGGRSIAARSGNYRPDDRAPVWEIDAALKCPANPHGVVSCTVGVFHRPTRSDPFERIVATVFWDEFAPIVKAADSDAYEWVGTGKHHPDNHPRFPGREIQRRQLRPGADGSVTERLDPKKEQWIKGGRHKIALCAEMQALRRGWPEDMSRLYVEEETDRHASVVDADYTELTASEIADQADATARLERIGGPALLATFDGAGTLERIPFGQFHDRVDAHTKAMAPADVVRFSDQNRVAFQEFWAHNKSDALAVKKLLEQRSQASVVA